MDLAGLTTDTRGHNALFHRYCPNRRIRTNTRMDEISAPMALAPGLIPPFGFAKVSVWEIAAVVMFANAVCMVLY